MSDDIDLKTLMNAHETLRHAEAMKGVSHAGHYLLRLAVENPYQRRMIVIALCSTRDLISTPEVERVLISHSVNPNTLDCSKVRDWINSI